MAETEFVWVVRRRDLFPDGAPQGFVPMAEPELEERYLGPIRARGFFVERREAEQSPEWKQPIPYCLVAHAGRLLCLERLAAQSERRLHGLLSIGVGGHVNPEDRVPGQDLLARAAAREVREELHVGRLPELRPLGLLNDDRNEVGRVHVGLVLGLAWPGPEPPRVRERGKMRGRLEPLARLREMCEALPTFESWSSLILEHRGWEDGFLRT